MAQELKSDVGSWKVYCVKEKDLMDLMDLMD